MSSDPVAILIETIKGLERLRNVRFSSTFLNCVGDLFEREGQAVTDCYLAVQEDRERAQAIEIRKLLPLLCECSEIRINRAIGRLIIKALPTITRQEESHVKAQHH